MLYNIVLVSAVPQHESVIGTPMPPPSWYSLPLPTPSHPLGCYRTLVWTNISWNHLNLIPSFIYSFIPSFSELSKSYMRYVLFMHKDYWPYLDFTSFCMQSGVYAWVLWNFITCLYTLVYYHHNQDTETFNHH